MQLLEIKVRDNWQSITQETFVENMQLWRIVQIAVILSTLIVLLLMAFSISGPVSAIFRRLVLPTVMVSMALWGIMRNADAHQLILRGTVGVFTVGILAYLVVPGLQAEIARSAVYYWSTPISIAIAGMSFAIFYLVGQHFPNVLSQLGLHSDRVGLSILLGTIIGLALGFHLLLVISYVPGAAYFHVTLPALLWSLFYHVGLRALSEEIFFRGLGFHLLYHGMHRNFRETAVQITALNILMYLVPASLTSNTIIGFWVIIYGTVLALTTTFLRYHQRSLVPALSCNVVFSIFLGMVVG